MLLAVIYIAFISLGLPDSLLGAAWPEMYTAFGVPLSCAGVISAIISAGTIVSSLQSDRLNLKLGTGKVTAISVCMTAVALLGFSFSHSFPLLCLWAIPYGLGAGSVDAALNNYVALHYESRHMSWLHCMWGIGAASGPYIMSWALTGGLGWNTGYRIVGLLQVALTAVLFATLPMWRKHQAAQPAESGEKRRPMALREVLRIPGAKEVLICFFCYCAIESTTGLWAASFLTLCRGVSAEAAAGFAAMFYIGITAGRAVSGFLTMKLSDKGMIRLGQGLILLGLALLLFGGTTVSVAGLIIIGLGCAPVYPCIIHSTPAHFGAERSQAVIGVQMAFAYMGSLGMPPLFGILADGISAALLPGFLLALLILMVVMHEALNRVTAHRT